MKDVLIFSRLIFVLNYKIICFVNIYYAYHISWPKRLEETFRTSSFLNNK